MEQRPEAFGGMLAAEPDPVVAMPLLPRWQFMTEQSKALVKRTAISVGVVVLVALILRSLLPWVMLVLLLWLAWKLLGRR